MKEFNISYDDKEDILYLGKEGEENEVVELSPLVNIELDKKGGLIGVEIFQASTLFKDIINSMTKKLQAA